MLYVITLLGILMCAAGLVGMMIPASLTRLASQVARSKPLRIMAVVLRILIGAFLIVASNATPYPLTMKIIGVIAIMAGTAVAMMGARNLEGLVEKFNENKNWCRVMSLAAALLGVFLIHASL